MTTNHSEENQQSNPQLSTSTSLFQITDDFETYIQKQTTPIGPFQPSHTQLLRFNNLAWTSLSKIHVVAIEVEKWILAFDDAAATGGDEDKNLKESFARILEISERDCSDHSNAKVIIDWAWDDKAGREGKEALCRAVFAPMMDLVDEMFEKSKSLDWGEGDLVNQRVCLM